jgi:hypothetical protein
LWCLRHVGRWSDDAVVVLTLVVVAATVALAVAGVMAWAFVVLRPVAATISVTAVFDRRGRCVVIALLDT